MKNTFLEHFNCHYYNRLNYKVNWRKRNVSNNLYQRGDGFRLVFELLLEKNFDNYNIVETGVLRTPDNWKDGQSTYLFQEFLRMANKPGHVDAVDINADHCNTAKEFLNGDLVSVHCEDSVKWLTNHPKKDICLYHLDSYDVKWPNPKPSAEHHLKEFIAIESSLEPGALVMIDDNTWFNRKRSGKGTDVYYYLKEKGIMPIHDDYQIIYQF